MRVSFLFILSTISLSVIADDKAENIETITNYAWPKANLNVTIVQTGEQADDFFPPFPPFRERVDLDSFTLVNVSASYDISSNIQLTARLQNVLDENYEEVFGFTAPAFSAHAGIKVRW